MRLLSDSDISDSFRNVVCVSEEEGEGCLELGSGLAPSDLELDSIAVAWNPGKKPEIEGDNAVFRELRCLSLNPWEVRMGMELQVNLNLGMG